MPYTQKSLELREFCLNYFLERGGTRVHFFPFKVGRNVFLFLIFIEGKRGKDKNFNNLQYRNFLRLVLNLHFDAN